MHTLTSSTDLIALRARERKTAETLREIDDHLARLKAAREQRQSALVKIRAQLALNAPAAPDADER